MIQWIGHKMKCKEWLERLGSFTGFQNLIFLFIYANNLAGLLFVCFAGCFISLLVLLQGWLASWLVGCLLLGWLVGWLGDQLAAWLFPCLIGWHIGWLIGCLLACLIHWLVVWLLSCLFVCLVSLLLIGKWIGGLVVSLAVLEFWKRTSPKVKKKLNKCTSDDERESFLKLSFMPSITSTG